MSRVAIITDSNSGITQSQAKEMGIRVVPMPFMIGDTGYFEDITLNQAQFYEMLKGDAAISTSMPSLDSLMEYWNDALKEYDEVVYIPMSSGLSGSCEAAVMLSREEEFEGKVFVANNQRISITQRQSVLDAMQMAQKGLGAEKIRDILEEDKFNSSIYIMLDTLYYLKKGGRITPAAAALGTILKLKPVLTIQGEKLDAFAKARTTGQGKSIMINAIRSDMENRFGGATPDNIYLARAYTYDEEAAAVWKREVEEAFPGFEVHMDPLSLSVSCHIGPGAIAVGCCKKLDI